MKKSLVLLLSIVLIICNSVVVWAEDVPSSNITGPTQNDVTGVFTKDSEGTYNVTITWGALKYRYAGSLTWNGETYDASKPAEGDYNTTWELVGNQNQDEMITVTNNSDKVINAAFAFAENGENLDVNTSQLAGTFKDDWNDTSGSMNVGSTAIVGSPATARKMQVGITGYPMGIFPVVDGKEVDLTTTGIKIGTVTVTISGVN